MWAFKSLIKIHFAGKYFGLIPLKETGKKYRKNNLAQCYLRFAGLLTSKASCLVTVRQPVYICPVGILRNADKIASRAMLFKAGSR